MKLAVNCIVIRIKRIFMSAYRQFNRMPVEVTYEVELSCNTASGLGFLSSFSVNHSMQKPFSMCNYVEFGMEYFTATLE